MRMLFERGYRMLPETIDDQTAPLAQALYAELGTEAMKENAEWVAIYRQRPIRPPHAWTRLAQRQRSVAVGSCGGTEA